MRNNHDLLSKLFEIMIGVISTSTSQAYAVITITNVIKNQTLEFPFLNYISLGAPSSGTSLYIKIDDQINSIDPRFMAKFITKLANAIFIADSVKEVITKEMRKNDPQLVEELESLGVII